MKGKRVINFSILGVYVLIIVPTHELAVQTFSQAQRLLRYHEYITVGVSMGGAQLTNEIELFSKHPRILRDDKETKKNRYLIIRIYTNCYSWSLCRTHPLAQYSGEGFCFSSSTGS